MDLHLYQYDECAVASLGVYGGISCGVLVLAIFFLLFSIRVLLRHAVLGPSYTVSRQNHPMYHSTIVSSFSPFVQPVVSLMLEELNSYLHFYFFECLGAAHAHVQSTYWK